VNSFKLAFSNLLAFILAYFLNSFYSLVVFLVFIFGGVGIWLELAYVYLMNYALLISSFFAMFFGLHSPSFS
jgi:hypothetical protein